METSTKGTWFDTSVYAENFQLYVQEYLTPAHVERDWYISKIAPLLMGLACRQYLLPLGHPPATTSTGTVSDAPTLQGESEPVSKFPFEGTATLAQAVDMIVVAIDSVVVVVVVVVSVSMIELMTVCSTSTTVVALTGSVAVTETVLVIVLATIDVAVIGTQLGSASIQLHAVWITDCASDSREERID